MKTTLTIEESARLIELGVDQKLATRSLITNESRFTLTDILSIMPKEIDNYELNISANKCEYFASYILWDTMDEGDYIRDILSFKQFSATELIDALNQLLIWCLTEKKINLNTKKK